MRITFICSSVNLTGGFRVIVSYAERLRRRGHDVLLVSCPRRKLSVRDFLRLIYLGRPLPWVPTNAPTHLDGTGVPYKILDRIRPPVASDLPDADIVLATWWKTAEWVWALPRQKGVKVHLVQDYELWGGRRDRVDATCRLPVPKITPSRWVQHLLLQQFGQTDVTCIPNAVDLETFTAPARGKQGVPTVGFTYTPFRPKGCDVTAAAIRFARQVRPELRVLCFGSSKPTPEMPLPEGAEFHLRAPDAELKHLYARCDAWLFGSRKEGFGLPILEAMACRTPVIATRAGAAPGLLAGDGGMLIAIEDARAMADAILNVCAMADGAWRKMSEAAYAAARRHTWDDATDAFEAVLQRASAASGGDERRAAGR